MKNLDKDRINILNSKKGVRALMLAQKPVDIEDLADQLLAQKKLEKLQAKMVTLQSSFIANQKRAVILIEGMDTTGKASCIKAITNFLNARNYNVVAFPKPKQNEPKSWYFQKYIEKLPQEEQMVFFNRSWYNRAVLEPISNMCTEKQYELFLKETVQFEHSLISDDIKVIKILLRIDKKEQASRIEAIKNNPLKSWKLNYFDMAINKKYDTFLDYENKMLKATSTPLSPWKLIEENKSIQAQIQVVDYVLKFLQD